MVGSLGRAEDSEFGGTGRGLQWSRMFAVVVVPLGIVVVLVSRDPVAVVNSMVSP